MLQAFPPSSFILPSLVLSSERIAHRQPLSASGPGHQQLQNFSLTCFEFSSVSALRYVYLVLDIT